MYSFLGRHLKIKVNAKYMSKSYLGNQSDFQQNGHSDDFISLDLSFI